MRSDNIDEDPKMKDPQKDIQRKVALYARRSLAQEERASFSEKISMRISKILMDGGRYTVLLYAAVWDEAAVRLDDRFHVSYPVIMPGYRMDAYHMPEECFVSGDHGIREPDPEKSILMHPYDFDAVIVPCVAFDEKCRRLGHGGGFYDRYLPKCENALLIAAAFEAQKIDNVITDEHDVPVDMVVTEREVYSR